MNKNDCLREALVFLDAVQGFYPGGIPKVKPPVASESAEETKTLVHFIGIIQPEGRIVLDAAITQGLKLTIDATVVSEISVEYAKDPTAIRKKIETELAKVHSQIIVLMGDVIADTFIPKKKRKDVDEAGFLLHDQRRFLITEDLGAVTSDVRAKKLFWNELKKARAFIAMRGSS